MEGLLLILLILSLLIAIRVFRCIARLSNPAARGKRGAAHEVFGCLTWCGIIAILIALILPALPIGTRESARRSYCRYNLKQIMLAMHNYHDRYGCLPPAYTVEKNRRPLHSWRVLLLPFLEEQALYQRIRLDEPYDSPYNRAVFDARRSSSQGLPAMPDVFRCPSDGANRGADTNYVMILGPRTLSNGPNSVCLKDISDGPGNTIAVVETYGLGTAWYEPRDLRADEMTFKINDPEYFGIASRHPGGAQVGLADGSVRFLPETLVPREVESLTTIHGKEDVSAALK